MDDYYRRGFGPAAGQLKAYWTLLEETRNRMVDDKLTFPQAYNAAFYKRAASLLDEADAVVAKAPEIYRRRIAYVRVGLDFTRNLIEAMELSTRCKTDKAAADRMRALWKEIEPIAKNKENYIYYHAFQEEWKARYPDSWK